MKPPSITSNQECIDRIYNFLQLSDMHLSLIERIKYEPGYHGVPEIIVKLQEINAMRIASARQILEWTDTQKTPFLFSDTDSLNHDNIDEIIGMIFEELRELTSPPRP